MDFLIKNGDFPLLVITACCVCNNQLSERGVEGGSKHLGLGGHFGSRLGCFHFNWRSGWSFSSGPGARWGKQRCSTRSLQFHWGSGTFTTAPAWPRRHLQVRAQIFGVSLGSVPGHLGVLRGFSHPEGWRQRSKDSHYRVQGCLLPNRAPGFLRWEGQASEGALGGGPT